MEALLTAIVVWLSANYSLPVSFDHPRVEFLSATKMTRLRMDNGSPQQKPGMVLISPKSEIVSLYNTRALSGGVESGIPNCA